MSFLLGNFVEFAWSCVMRPWGWLELCQSVVIVRLLLLNPWARLWGKGWNSDGWIVQTRMTLFWFSNDLICLGNKLIKYFKMYWLNFFFYLLIDAVHKERKVIRLFRIFMVSLVNHILSVCPYLSNLVGALDDYRTTSPQKSVSPVKSLRSRSRSGSPLRRRSRSRSR